MIKCIHINKEDNNCIINKGCGWRGEFCCVTMLDETCDYRTEEGIIMILPLSIWTEIERQEDITTEGRRRREDEIRDKLKLVAVCNYREYSGMYNIRCLEPQRRRGGRCVGINCPLLFK